MNLLSPLERQLEKLDMSNLTYYLIGGQVLMYITATLNPAVKGFITLRSDLVLAGQWWRMITFLIIPFSYDPLWVVFSWYLMYLFGSALERTWGAARYFLYLTVAYIATLASSFLFPAQALSNGYIYSSIFLAASYLFPDFRLLLFFLIPVKLRWLGILTWAGIIFSLVTGDLQTKVLSIISVGNFLMFFGSSLLQGLTSLRGKTLSPAKHSGSYMLCLVCGKTEHDGKIFYYCHVCKPETQYCEDHIRDHVHLQREKKGV